MRSEIQIVRARRHQTIICIAFARHADGRAEWKLNRDLAVVAFIVIADEDAAKLGFRIDRIELDRDLQSPLGAFVPGGPLVLVSGHHVLLLEIDSQGVHSVTPMELNGQPAVAISAAANPGEFALLRENGEMTVYRLPR